MINTILLVLALIIGVQSCGPRQKVQENVSVTPSPEQRSSPENSKLFQAISNDDVNEVRNLIKDGTDVNRRDESDYTPLRLAVLKGNKEIVAALIDANADLNAVQPSNETALIIAIDFHKTEIVRLLLDKGADPDVPDAGHWNEVGLHKAAELGYLDLVLLVIPKSKNIDVKNIEGETPLALALGNRKIAKALISAGADINARDNYQNSILMKATGDVPLMRFLIERGAVDGPNEDGWTALKEAYLIGCPKAIAVLKTAAKKE